MAPRASATVHKLTPRKARGAKSTGGKKAASRGKPRPGAKEIPAQPSDAQLRRDRQDRMLALDHQIKTTENKITIAQEALTDLRTLKKQQRAALGAFYPLELYDDARADAARKTEKVDLVLREKQRAEIREAFGLPAGPQAELDLQLQPIPARTATHWYDVGAKDCSDDKFADANAAGVPPEHVQDYLRGHADRQAQIAAGLKGLKEDEAKKPNLPPPLMVGQKGPATGDAVANEETADTTAALGGDGIAGAPQWDDWPADPQAWSADQRDQFEAWYTTLGPDDEVDVKHAGAAAMFDILLAAEEAPVPPALDDAPPSPPVEVHVGAAPAGVDYMLAQDEPYASGRQATYRDGKPLDSAPPGALPVYERHTGDEFEASQEELQGQSARVAVQERRAYDPAPQAEFSEG